MNKTTKFLGCCLALIMVSKTASAQWGADWVPNVFYENARHNNLGTIRRMLRNGLSIDTTDSSGDTALCIAMQHRDTRAYNVLVQNGANSRHPCTRQFAEEKTLAYRGGFVWKPIYTVGAVAVVGGVVALAVGGGGGSGKKASNPDNPNNGGGGGNNDEHVGDGGVDSGDIETSLDPSYFETEEYEKGNFLPQINASKAYARIYGLNSDGKLTSNINSVSVGVMDTGVYSDNSDFDSTSVKGFNHDFGPCRNGDTTNCWYYSNNEMILRPSNPDSFGGYQVIRVSTTEEDYKEWANKYASDYDWENESTEWQPQKGTSFAHGTHVGGIIAADKNDSNMHGVAFSNAKLIAARWDMRLPAYLTLGRLVDMGAEVVNMSFGADARKYDATKANYYKDYIKADILQDIDNVLSHNVVMVMAAGNEGYSQPSLYNGIPLIPEYTDKLKNLFVTVVATGSDGKITSYSNRCGVSKAYCIAAPGGDDSKPIVSTGTYDYATLSMQGTSMATPVVSGSIALLMGAYPYMEPQEIVELIFDTANKTGVYANEDIYGNGMLDLAEATNPQGALDTYSGNSVTSGVKTNVAATRVTVSAAFKEALLKNMPKTVTVFDKYKRPFDMKFSALVSTTHSGEKKFKNDLYNFSRHQPKKNISSEGFSFAFAPSSYSNNDSGMGIVDMSYEGDMYKTSFFFAENTEFSSGNYQDKALFNPYLAMNEAYGVENKFMFDKLGVKFGFMTGENGLYDGDRSYHDYDFDSRAYAFNSQVDYQLTSQFNIAAVSGVLSEDNALLGMNGRGALDVGDSNTFYTGLMLNWQPNANWSFGGAYYHGWTDNSETNGMMKVSRLMSDSFAFDGHYNMNKTDVIGLQVSSPLRIYNGHADFDIATGRDNYSSTIYRENVRANLKPKAREYKFALYHNRELSEDILFKSELAARINPDHQSDAETDYRAMFGLSWAF